LYGQDKTLSCADCNQEFVFTASEQAFFAERQFSEPRRCPPAAQPARRRAAIAPAAQAAIPAAAARRRYSSGPREMFSATCSSCGREAQVPFRPSGAKPVYCSDCFSSQRASSNRY